MLCHPLDCSARQLLAHFSAALPHLATPALLWNGASQQVVLCFNPSQSQLCWSKSDLENLEECVVQPSTAGETTGTASWSSFSSGWLGYFAYEAGAQFVCGPSEPSNTPLAEFFYYDFSLHLDLTHNTVTLMAPNKAALQQAQAEVQPLLHTAINRPATRAQKNRPAPWQAAWQAEHYQAAFQQVQRYLQAGDCYQVNLAMPFTCSQDLRQQCPLALLEAFNPTFGGYLKTHNQTLFSVSPERFISIQGTHIETRPIKGTVARSADLATDKANQQWLANSPKNQAENLMIVDLLRNDLSRYALPNSVKVEKLFALESHANVHHLVSTISAQKPETISPLQVFLSALPGGSITGAPKKRAMEIIAELEVAERGPYCGSFGFFDQSGYSDFNILIRTIVAREHEAHCWAGGGIVIDSTCAEEWQELHTKVAKILQIF